MAYEYNPVRQFDYTTGKLNETIADVEVLSGKTTALEESAVKGVKIAGESIVDPGSKTADITPANLKGDFKGLNVGSSDTTRGIETNDNVIVVETAALATTGGDKDIDPNETGATALLVYVKGGNVTAGEYKPSTISNNYAPASGETYNFTVQVTDNDRFTGFILASGATLQITGTSVGLSALAPYTGETNGFSFSGTPTAASAETFNVTAPAFQTVTFPIITAFKSSGYNQLTGATALVIKGNRYAIVPTGTTAPTVTINGSGQTVETNVPCARGHVIPYSFVPTETGEATFTEARIVALVWSGKYCERTTNTGYTVSTIAIPADYQTLRSVGTSYDELRPGQYTKRITSVPTDTTGLTSTASMQRIVTQDTIWYAGEPTGTTLSNDWSFTANDFGQVWFVYSAGAGIPLEFETVFGVNLVDKLTRDVLTISEQSLTAAQKSQVHANLGLEHVVFTVTYDDGTAGAVNLVGYSV